MSRRITVDDFREEMYKDFKLLKDRYITEKDCKTKYHWNALCNMVQAFYDKHVFVLKRRFRLLEFRAAHGWFVPNELFILNSMSDELVSWLQDINEDDKLPLKVGKRIGFGH